MKKYGSCSHVCQRPDIQNKRLAHVHHALHERVGLYPTCIHEKAAKPFRLLDPEDLTNCSTGRVADKMRILDAKSVHQLDYVAGHLINGILYLLTGALACAAMIVNNDLEMAA
jgi:hypothetical protein